MLLPLSHAALLMSALGAVPSVPATKAPIILAQTNPIHGADPTDDKGRSGPDGWVQAPVSRDAAANGSAKAPGESATSQTATGVTSAGSKPMTSGEDPGTPSDSTRTATPGQAPK
ncbi:hypothetical protein [Beijerinckia sp. L45]|uniref:hypothetical protein n=1 Tax=Beijerinckia sp. L45 TaxID=1641855 RepID=UPI00131C6472|nr:hypothetical protein [Beijerinckia sp. L45]